jgi:CubicO group peptidase (beta-lactamase class C family)
MSHRLVVLTEAPNVEAVRDFAMETGLVQWNSLEIYPAWGLDEAVRQATDTALQMIINGGRPAAPSLQGHVSNRGAVPSMRSAQRAQGRRPGPPRCAFGHGWGLPSPHVT